MNRMSSCSIFALLAAGTTVSLVYDSSSPYRPGETSRSTNANADLTNQSHHGLESPIETRDPWPRTDVDTTDVGIPLPRPPYPVIHLGDRLAYESLDLSRTIRQARESLPESVASSLDQAEAAFQRTSSPRQEFFRAFNEQTINSFENENGFGVFRAPILDVPLFFQIPEIEIRKTDGSWLKEYLIPEAVETEANALADAPRDVYLSSIHSDAVADFIRKGTLGYVPDQRSAAGFVSHHFSKFPDVGDRSRDHSSLWQLTRLELVSVLKHATPVAYRSDSLPRGDRLSNALTRDLDEIELSLFRELSDVDVAIEATPSRTQVLGAIRAHKGCQDCHDAPRGTLLGAFTYEFQVVE